MINSYPIDPIESVLAKIDAFWHLPSIDIIDSLVLCPFFVPKPLLPTPPSPSAAPSSPSPITHPQIMNKYRAHPSILLSGKNSITAYVQRLPPLLARLRQMQANMPVYLRAIIA
jgi:hypothetical protein